MNKKYLKVGDICKHFKGKNLIEKNIYEIIALEVKYTGTNEGIELGNLVIYKPLFQEDKYYAREYDDFVCDLSSEEKITYNQQHRVELLNSDELDEIKKEEFILKKRKYINSKYN